MEHTHRFTLLVPGPPKTFGCAELGCKAQAEIDPVTKGPGQLIEPKAQTPAGSTPPPPAPKEEEF